ncbi:MAG: hypothetical protein JHC41_02150 [Nitrosopumilus sp.]|jgi:hypothetical protein|nr:hypothetical protein [Nitrosopumilus sp.]
MRRSVHEDIKGLEKEILQTEDKIIEYLRVGYEGGIKTSLHSLDSNLKYLSILANGAPIDRNEDRKIMDFLRIHYDYMQKLSVPA